MMESLGGERWGKCQQLGYLGILLVIGHTFVLGVGNFASG